MKERGALAPFGIWIQDEVLAFGLKELTLPISYPLGPAKLLILSVTVHQLNRWI